MALDSLRIDNFFVANSSFFNGLITICGIFIPKYVDLRTFVVESTSVPGLGGAEEG